jgi:hypothetical protein
MPVWIALWIRRHRQFMIIRIGKLSFEATTIFGRHLHQSLHRLGTVVCELARPNFNRSGCQRSHTLAIAQCHQMLRILDSRLVLAKVDIVLVSPGEGFGIGLIVALVDLSH